MLLVVHVFKNTNLAKKMLSYLKNVKALTLEHFKGDLKIRDTSTTGIHIFNM